MKKRLIALSVTIIMLLHILATPTYAIIEEVEDLNKNSQQEETQEIQETQKTPEEPKQEENKEEGEEEKVEPKKAPALKSPEQPVGVVEDKTLQEVINFNYGYSSFFDDIFFSNVFCCFYCYFDRNIR